MNTKVFIIGTIDNTKSKNCVCEKCPVYGQCVDANICDTFKINDAEIIDNIKEVNLENSLNATIPQMVSDNYKNNFIAEFNQTYIRFTKLRDMCQKWYNNELDEVPAGPKEIYDAQLTYMLNYLAILWVRAEMEGITLEVNPEDTDMINTINIDDIQFINEL